MTSFPDEIWFLIGLVSFAAVISVLNTFAAGIRNGRELHDARVAVAKLQIQYAEHLNELMYGGQVDIVEDDEESAPGDEQEVQPAIELDAVELVASEVDEPVAAQAA